MRDPILSMLNAIDREAGGIAIIRYPDFGLLDWLVDQVKSLVPDDTSILRASTVDEALEAPERLVLLVPSDEREAVLDLDASRDRVLRADVRRSQPIVLFLLTDGQGNDALTTSAPSLRSWVSGSDTDPEELARIDVAAERERFAREHGATPEEWLARWRAGEVPESGVNYRTAYDAAMLDQEKSR